MDGGVCVAQRGAQVAGRGTHPGEALLETGDVLGIVEDLFLGKARQEINELRLL